MLLYLCNFQRRERHSYLCSYSHSSKIYAIIHMLRNALLRTEFLVETFFLLASNTAWISEELFSLPYVVETHFLRQKYIWGHLHRDSVPDVHVYISKTQHH